MTNLDKLRFKDIFLGEISAWLTAVPSEGDPVAAPESCREELQELWRRCDHILKESGKKEFPIKVGSSVFRASALTATNEQVFVLRRSPLEVPSIEKIGLNTKYVERLMAPKLSGLIVVSGSFAQGKTTTASSLVLSRITRFGGVAISIEDPPELPLEGRHGEGVCYQTQVEQGGFGEACRRQARWSPAIIFLGEIRDSESAVEALGASSNGRLVICTTHSYNIPMAIERLYILACRAGGNSEDVASLLSAGLLAVLHQRLDVDTVGRHTLKANMLWLGDGDNNLGVRNIIRLRKFDQLVNEIDLQSKQMNRGQ